jgi:hypothetical protein
LPDGVTRSGSKRRWPSCATCDLALTWREGWLRCWGTHNTDVVESSANNSAVPRTGSARGMRWVAVAFALIAAALLGLRAILSGAAAAQVNEFAWAGAIVCVLAAASALVAAGAVVNRSGLAVPAFAIALVLALVAEVLPAGPPRLLPLVPLLVAGAAA